MPRPGKGFTAAQWNVLSLEERERIKKEHTKEAVRSACKKYYEAHAEQLKEQSAQNYENNAEKIRENSKRRYYANREARLQHAREYNQRKKAERDALIVELEKCKTIIAQHKILTN